MKRAALALALALTLAPAPALAYHGGDDGGDHYSQRDGCGEQGGGCDNERHEHYENGGCKYCPSFKDSPVYICFPGATCYFTDPNKKEQPK